MTDPFKVLFVCTGNSCRSPMAAELLKKILKSKGIHHILVASAGTMAPPDQQPTNEAQLVMVERGVNISKHRSRNLTNRMIGEADLILVMERAHQSYIEKYVPSSRGKVFLLKAFGEKPEIGDIEDPIGRDLEFYRHSAEILELEINRILPALLEWSGKK